VASSKYVAFVRNTSSAKELLLFNRTTGSTTKIASGRLSCSFCINPDWVGSSHLVYDICSYTTDACVVRVLTIGGAKVTVPGNPAPYSNYGASMDESTGNVYYISSNTRCGLFDKIDRWNIAGGSPTDMYDLPEGIDGSETSLAPDPTTPGNLDLYYSQYDCLANNLDIYEIPSANTL
jgi:hypothetical protein